MGLAMSRISEDSNVIDGSPGDVVELYDVDAADVLEVSDEISAEFHDAYVRLSDLP